MSKYKVLYLVLMITSSANSQDCTKEALRIKQGTWKANQQGSINNVTSSDLTKEKSVLAVVHKMMTTNYNPTGCQVSYSTVFGKYLNAGKNWVADPYQYTMYILRFLCDQQSKDKSKYYVDISTPTTVEISANAIYFVGSMYACDLPDDEIRGYLKIKKKPIQKDGAWFLGEEIVGDYGMESEIRQYQWLITYNDTLPFSYVSRKEYLMLQMKRLQQDLKDNPGEKEYTNQYIKKVETVLKNDETVLSQPAICMWNDEERFEKFVEEGTSGSFIAIKPNLKYYHKNLPKSSPQLFSITYTVSKGDPVFSENIEGIKQAADFGKLKDLLGK